MHTLEGVSHQDQYRALGLSTLAFTVCFAVWTIFSIIGVKIKQELGLIPRMVEKFPTARLHLDIHKHPAKLRLHQIHRAVL